MNLTAIYRNKTPSPETKITLVCIHFLIVLAVAWLLLGSGMEALDVFFKQSHHSASEFQRLVLLAAAILYFLRTLVTILIFMRRRMPWVEVVTISLWILLLDVLFAYLGGRNETPFGTVDIFGIVLLIAGSVINTGSEWQRHLWKQQPENEGHVYTGGLFRYARHINYFGDEVLFTGWVLLTGQTALLVIPILMALGFFFGNIPALDRYLAERYGDEYRVYARTVKSFIPYVC